LGFNLVWNSRRERPIRSNQPASRQCPSRLIQVVAVPGMPVSSPGMEGAQPKAHDVMSFDENGRSSVFMNIPAGK
jgi:hypothetical protein